jgi:hypothetical protein
MPASEGQLAVDDRFMAVKWLAAVWSSSVARWAHNPEVASSNLVTATESGPLP